MSEDINYFDIFRWEHYLKVLKFYVLIMSIVFWEKGGIVFKGGHYMREDIIQGNTVHIEIQFISYESTQTALTGYFE